MKTNWSKYKKVWQTLSPEAKKDFKQLAKETNGNYWEDNTGDDYSVNITYRKQLEPTIGFDVSLKLIDSGDADDGEYGIHGNWLFDIVEFGGRIISSYAPNNYTNDVWVDYDDIKDFESRLKYILGGIGEIYRKIEETKAKLKIFHQKELARL
mgnify:CR=1 FL=1